VATEGWDRLRGGAGAKRRRDGIALALVALSGVLTALSLRSMWSPTDEKPSLPERGWWGDLVVAQPLLLLHMFADYRPSIPGVSGWLKPLLLMLAFPLLPAAIVFGHEEWAGRIGLVKRPRDQFHARLQRIALVIKVIANVAVVGIGLYELRQWFAVVKEWDETHCFLDGFMNTSTSRARYATDIITAGYFLSLPYIADTWITPAIARREWGRLLFGVILGPTLFYNYTAGLVAMFVSTDTWAA
jgi:hypothetical protein